MYGNATILLAKVIFKPAICEPICEPPVCRNICEKPKASNCTTSCGENACKILCPNDACPEHDCPKCKAVCDDLSCSTTCGVSHQDKVSSQASCKTVCDTPNCDWKCKKPTNCDKPTCELHCKTPDCAQHQIKNCTQCNDANQAFRFKSTIFHQDEQNPYCCNEK